ncbi:MAG: hypothetical protein O3C45_08950 [Bacteroidetes bacterium]|nr:hypothetical protein [Bacteroidota bacterium]
MKRTLLLLAAAAFMAVLFAKPFDFVSHYSEHARHATHAISTNPDVPADQQLLIEYAKASTESGHVVLGGWIVLLTVLGIFTLVGLTLIRRKQEERRCRQSGLC